MNDVSTKGVGSLDLLIRRVRKREIVGGCERDCLVVRTSVLKARCLSASGVQAR